MIWVYDKIRSSLLEVQALGHFSLFFFFLANGTECFFSVINSLVECLRVCFVIYTLCYSDEAAE